MLSINKRESFCRIFIFTYFCLTEIANIIIAYFVKFSFLTTVIMIMKLVLLLILLFKTFSKVFLPIFITITILILLFILSYTIHMENEQYFGDIFKCLCTDIIPVCLIFYYIEDGKKILDYLKIPAELTCIYACIMPYSPMYTTIRNSREVNLYMTVGYGSLLCCAIVAYYAIHYKSIIDITILIVTIINYTLYANRGVLLCISGYLLFCFYNEIKTAKKILYSLVLIGVSGYLYNNFYALMYKISNTLDTYKIESRTLQMILNKQFVVDKARESIYKRCIIQISEKPFGSGIGYDRIINSGVQNSYAHNLELELWVQFGVIFGTFIIIAIFFTFFYMFFQKERNEIRDLYMIFFIPFIIQLQMSSSIFLSYQIPVACFLFYTTVRQTKMCKNR